MFLNCNDIYIDIKNNKNIILIYFKKHFQNILSKHCF
jgi:hypothetical protein